MPLLRALLAAALLAVPLQAGPAAAVPVTALPAAAQQPESAAALRDRVAALRGDVDRAADELETGAAAVEQAEARLGELTSRQVQVARALDGASTAVTRAQQGVDALARAAYKGAVLPPTLSAVLTGDPRALADLARVRSAVATTSSARAEEVRALAADRATTQDALTESEQLRAEALAVRRSLEADVAALGARSAQLARQLSATSTALDAALVREAEAARAAAAAAASAAAARAATAREAAARAAVVVPAAGTAPAGCAPATDGGYANGFLPASALCPSVDGALLRTDAATALLSLAAAYEADLGAPLCVTDSYRSYAGQVDVFRRKPALAAVPGRSQHGWGLAVDLCGGVEDFGSPAHAWMRANAPRFGWEHPAWARVDGSKPEAWHWEFGDRS